MLNKPMAVPRSSSNLDNSSQVVLVQAMPCSKTMLVPIHNSSSTWEPTSILLALLSSSNNSTMLCCKDSLTCWAALNSSSNSKVSKISSTMVSSSHSK